MVADFVAFFACTIAVFCVIELTKQVLVLHTKQSNRRRRRRSAVKTWTRMHICDLPTRGGCRGHHTPARLYRVQDEQTPQHSQESTECPNAPRKETGHSSTSKGLLPEGRFTGSGLDIFRTWRDQSHSPRSENGPTPTQGTRRSRSLEPYTME